MRLFNGNQIDDYMREIWEKIREDINNIPDQDILSLDINDFVSYYYDKYHVEPITLLKEEINSSIEETKIKKDNPFYRDFGYGLEQKYFLVDGYRIYYDIPFNGESDLLFLQPTMRILKKFEIDNIKNRNSMDYLPFICFSVEIEAQKLDESDNPQQLIDDNFKREFSSYESMISNVNVSINNFNSNLKNKVNELLTEKYNKSSKFSSLMSKINIPLKRNDKAPNVTPLTLNIKKEPIKYPEKKNVSIDYCVSEDDYINIKEIISQSCISFESTSLTFCKLSEEELRDVILSNLNTHYDNKATGETFSKVGKTDIRIQFDNKAAYIAECKIWHGISEFKKAVSQLFSYTRWRDVKTSLIIFNKDVKNFSTVLSKIDNELHTNELCINVQNIEKNCWQCTFKKYSDCDELIQLNILVCDLFADN